MREANILGEAVGLFQGELEDDLSISEVMGVDGESGEDGGLVLELDGNLIAFEESAGGIENASEFPRFDAVIIVVSEPDLEDAGLLGVLSSTAIDEGFR